MALGSGKKKDKYNILILDTASYVMKNYNRMDSGFNPAAVSDSEQSHHHTPANEDDGVQYSIKTPANGDNFNSDVTDRVFKNIMGADGFGRTEIDELLDHTDMTFVDKLLEHINRKNLKDSRVYKAAQVDRRLFSKIVSDRLYKPSKDTCIALALALELSLQEAKDLISRAGYTLSHSNVRDLMIEFFFKERVYDINTVNQILYDLEQKVLGRN